MDGNVNSNDNLATANNDAGDAVGVSQPFRWYVAIVSNNTEKVCAEKIAALGYDTYVPTQKELRRWKNGRRKIIDRIVIPAAVFVRCTEADRRHHVVNLPFVKRFMVNRAAATNQYGRHPVAIVPDREIEKLRFYPLQLRCRHHYRAPAAASWRQGACCARQTPWTRRQHRKMRKPRLIRCRQPRHRSAARHPRLCPHEHIANGSGENMKMIYN